MKSLIFILYVLLGIGRNLPYTGIYFFGLGPADVLFCLLCFFLLLGYGARREIGSEIGVLRIPVVSTACISVLAMVSLVYNAPIYGVELKDAFEILKYLYLIAVMVVTSHYTRKMGMVPAIGFVIGVIVSGIIAFLNPMNPDIFGTRQIFNPNVIGNVLSVSIVFCSFAAGGGYPGIAGMLAVCAATISFFTFSKGTWLMTSFALLTFWLTLSGIDSRNTGLALKFGKYIGLIMLGGLLYLLYQFWDLVSLILNAKIAATDFQASATDGGSFSARYGLILSAIQMFLMNPVLGVGISNFDNVNNLLESELGDSFYEDDNPNSAWFYVLGCMGLPAFIFFCLIFYWFLRRLHRIPFANLKTRPLYTFCIGTVFLIGGNVQLEMLTAYYYWVALGMIAAWSTVTVTKQKLSTSQVNDETVQTCDR